jgi:hypothetical protein
MRRISRRQALSTLAASATGVVAAAIGRQPVLASFSPSVPSRRYLKFAGTDFFARSTVQPGGARSERTYFDNGSIYSSGDNDIFVARVQVPDRSIIEEIQFSYSITDSEGVRFEFFGFDLEDDFAGFAEPVDAPDPVDPDPLHIRTYTMQGTPVTVDNSTWAYYLRYGPREPGPAHILWGARVGYRPGAGGQ